MRGPIIYDFWKPPNGGLRADAKVGFGMTPGAPDEKC